MQLFRTSFKAMGCINEIAASAENAETAERAMQLAAREVLRIEKKYSRYRQDEDSIVYRINRSAGGVPAVTCDPETMELLRFADRMFNLSGGLFDITSGVLRHVWDFTKSAPPEPGAVAPLLKLIGWSRVEIGNDTVRLPVAGMEIDFGGFGKEYATDRAASVLRANGIKNGYVNLGGDIRAIGHQPGGNPWLFGVQDPRKAGAVIASIPISDGALATSGDYEKFLKHNENHYCHILNPFDGMSVKCWRSVSVVGVTTLSSGAMTTIAMLKEAEAVSFLEESNFSYLLVDAEGRISTNRQSTELEQF